jgi:Complex I intermediate-associated protein 30 (CIA30)
VCAGSIYSRSGVAEWGGPIRDMGGFEGFHIVALTDGKPYFCIVVDDEGNSYVARFNTKQGYSRVRLMANMFRAEVRPDATEPPPRLRTERIAVLKFRCANASGCACSLRVLPSCGACFWNTISACGGQRQQAPSTSRRRLFTISLVPNVRSAGTLRPDTPDLSSSQQIRSGRAGTTRARS